MTHPHSPIRNPDTGEVTSAVDWLGKRFSVGERVLYCIGAGRGQLIAYGKVLRIDAVSGERPAPRKIEPGEIADFEDDGIGYVYDWERYEQVTVQVLTERTSGEYEHGKRKLPAKVNPLNITALPITEDRTRDDPPVLLAPNTPPNVLSGFDK